MKTTIKKVFFQRLNLLVIFSTLLFSFLLVKAERAILLNDLDNKGDSIARILATVTLDAVMSHDYATVERYVSDIVKDSSITALSVERSDGEILARYGNSEDSGPTLTVSRPVTLGSHDFGEVHITFSTERVKIISRNLLLGTVAAVVLFHLLGLFMSNFALRKAVLTPLAKLNEAIRTLKKGNFNQTVSLTEPMEFAAIGDSFNDMAAKIKKSFADIRIQQENLQFEQDKLAAIVDSMADGLFVTDNDGVIIAFNQSAHDITGYTEQEANGHKCSDLFQSTLCKDSCALNHLGETIRNKETTLKTKDGRIRNVSVSSAMLFDSEDSPVGGVQTFRDITAEKKRQEMYCHTEKLVAIGQLAAGVAHEINNPLSNIIGYARLIKPGARKEEIDKRISVIVEQARKCSEIVRGLLNYSRSSGAEPAMFALSPLIAKVIDMVRHKAEKQGTQIDFKPSGEYSVYADVSKIEQVIFNLLLNALQTTPKAKNIWVTSGRAGNNIYFSIEDDGPGVDAEMHQKIFDPFYTTKPVGEGTGLGLSICAGIVAEADGSIDIEPRAGGGVVFTVLLPEKENIV